MARPLRIEFHGAVYHITSCGDRREANDRHIPKAQRRTTRPLDEWLAICETREEALYRAHTESALSMTAMACELGLSVSRIIRLIAKAEQAKSKA